MSAAQAALEQFLQRLWLDIGGDPYRSGQCGGGEPSPRGDVRQALLSIVGKEVAQPVDAKSRCRSWNPQTAIRQAGESFEATTDVEGTRPQNFGTVPCALVESGCRKAPIPGRLGMVPSDPRSAFKLAGFTVISGSPKAGLTQREHGGVSNAVSTSVSIRGLQMLDAKLEARKRKQN